LSPGQESRPNAINDSGTIVGYSYLNGLKRACLWLQDVLLDIEEVEFRLAGLKFRGCKGATGTQAAT
jgi:hypothetical protein